MRQFVRKMFAPLLNKLEAGDEPYAYKKSNRTILLAVGSLFLVLFSLVLAAGIVFKMLGALIPCVVFFIVGISCLVVGLLGSDRAVSKIWGGK